MGLNYSGFPNNSMQKVGEVGMAEARAWVMIPKRDGKADEIVLDMHPLVLCKDCKHYKRDTCSAGAGIAFPPPDDWFCADGEKR